jgi:outer membrane murein-binding lipoprotein Lpp
MESIVQEAKKEERGIQFIEERLLALEKKVEEIAQTVKELSSEITTLKQQPQATSQVQAINEPKAKIETKQNEEEERFVLTKTGAIEKRKVKKAAYIEAHP